MEDGTPVEEHLGELLLERKETIAVAESCTGGLVGSLITDVPGSSKYFIGGIISYMNKTKLQKLAISRETLERYGAVSQPVAREMAQHIRDEVDAVWAISTTGYAGPNAEAVQESIGEVYIGIGYAGRSETDPSYSIVEHHQFEGSRNDVKEQIARQALTSLWIQIKAKE